MASLSSIGALPGDLEHDRGRYANTGLGGCESLELEELEGEWATALARVALLLLLYREVYLHSCFPLEKHRGRISTSAFGV